MADSHSFRPRGIAAAQQAANNRQLVSYTTHNDVLLGRGNHVNNMGNLQFRKLVQARSEEYCSCDNKPAKDAIARLIVDSVALLGGRFLRKVAQNSASDSVTPLWEIADSETVLIKVKQTFRDHTAAIRKGSTAGALSASVLDSIAALRSVQGLLAPEELRLLDPRGILPSLQQFPPMNPGNFHSLPLHHPMRPIESLQATQLQHLSNVMQQQVRRQNEQEQQLQLLLGQQRAILLSQLQSEPSKHPEMSAPRFSERASQAPQDTSGLQDALLGIHLARQEAQRQRQSDEHRATWQPTQPPLYTQADHQYGGSQAQLEQALLFTTGVDMPFFHAGSGGFATSRPSDFEPSIFATGEPPNPVANFGLTASIGRPTSNIPIDPIDARIQRRDEPHSTPPAHLPDADDDDVVTRTHKRKNPPSDSF